MSTHKIVRLLIPTPWQALGCFAGGMVVMLAAYWSIVVQEVAADLGTNQANLGIALTHQVSLLDDLPYSSHIPGVIFWFIILMTLYLAYLKIHNAMVELYNEYVVATEFTGQPSLGAHLIQIVPRIGLYLAFLVLLVVSWEVLGPAWLGLANQYVWSLFLPQYLPGFLLGLLALIVNLYVFVVVIQLMLYE